MTHRITITIPLTYNDGERLSVGTINRIEQHLADRYGGFLRIEIEGAWGSGTDPVFRESVYRYEMFVTIGNIDPVTHQPVLHYHDLQEYALTVQKLLKQDCILTTYEAVHYDLMGDSGDDL